MVDTERHDMSNNTYAIDFFRNVSGAPLQVTSMKTGSCHRLGNGRRLLRRELILRAIPPLGDTVLDSMVGQFFGDERLCEAYLQVFGSADEQPKPVLAIDLSIHALRHAQHCPGLMRHERSIAAWVALVEGCGLYLHQLEQRGLGAEPERMTQDELVQLRDDALYPVLRQLRQRSPALGALITAVLEADCASEQVPDEQQVARIRSAVQQAHRYTN